MRIQWLAAFPVHMPDRATAAGGWTAGPPDSASMGPSGHHPGGHTAGYRGTEQRTRRVETIPGAVHIFWREHLDEKGAFQPASGRRRPPEPRRPLLTVEIARRERWGGLRHRPPPWACRDGGRRPGDGPANPPVLMFPRPTESSGTVGSGRRQQNQSREGKPDVTMVRRLLKLIKGDGRRPARVPDGVRVYTVGDIHGRVDLLRDLHRMIRDGASRAPGGIEKTAIYLGDYVDRGYDFHKPGGYLGNVGWYLAGGGPALRRPETLRLRPSAGHGPVAGAGLRGMGGAPGQTRQAGMAAAAGGMGPAKRGRPARRYERRAVQRLIVCCA